MGVGTPPQIQDLEIFREFVTEHSNLTPKKMAQLWGNNATQPNISYACRKLGITRKKKTYGYSERDEEERQKFIKKLESIENQKNLCSGATPVGFPDKRERAPREMKLDLTRERTIPMVIVLKEKDVML